MMSGIRNEPLGQLWNSFGELCRSLMSTDRYQCDLIDFLAYFSDDQYSPINNDHQFIHFDVNHMDSRQRTLLHTAASNGDLGVVRALLCTQNINLDILDKDECTPLCIALRDSHFEMAQVLIEAGADVNLGGGIYGSALHLAVVRANLLLTDMLIKRGAEVNVVDVDGNTPLHFIMNVFSKSES